jgi:hypothetical protein
MHGPSSANRRRVRAALGMLAPFVVRDLDCQEPRKRSSNREYPVSLPQSGANRTSCNSWGPEARPLMPRRGPLPGPSGFPALHGRPWRLVGATVSAGCFLRGLHRHHMSSGEECQAIEAGWPTSEHERRLRPAWQGRQAVPRAKVGVLNQYQDARWSLRVAGMPVFPAGACTGARTTKGTSIGISFPSAKQGPKP